MRKVAVVFIVAVMLPSLALAWLAVRSLNDQSIVLERQRLLLYEGVAGSLVKDIVEVFAGVRRDFGRLVESFLAERKAEQAAYSFDEELLKNWHMADVGFAVNMDGTIYSPSPLGRSEARRFRVENDKFLSSRETVEFYWNSPKGTINLSKIDGAVEKQFGGEGKGFSKMAEFRRLVADNPEGSLARFLQNELKLLIWYRSPNQPDVIFGAQLKLPELLEQIRPLIKSERAYPAEICVALLNDTGKPVASTKPGFETDWNRAFVSSEIGEFLPHWEVAVSLLNPKIIRKSAQTAQLTLLLLIAVLLIAIGTGGGLIVADLRRQMALARQKTDFVSNVSHELKTPLTSIRMFSELLADDRVSDEGKRRDYLRIITAETARLTRLINNVLDFSRMERGEKQYDFRECDLVPLVRQTLESYRPQLEAGGFKVEFESALAEIKVRCDPDALSQVILNLLSNAEKYSGETKEVIVIMGLDTGKNMALMRVADRGLGVPRGTEEKIFEQFYRAHDALSSGIQGSGLGLTLARQIARAHGGEVRYEPRPEGGSIFELRLPILR